MASPKSSKNKKTKKVTTPVTPKIEKIEEIEEIKEEPKKEAQSYLVPIAFLREPMDKNIPVADLFYHKYSNSFSLQVSAPQHMAAVEDIVEGDISIEESGSVKMISRSESPVSWIIGLKDSREFSGHPFIAGEAQEIYEA
tara:strand:+ start:375 stop:794 length:420 start_codon:yes stop_codon:yes gene_type:complete